MRGAVTATRGLGGGQELGTPWEVTSTVEEGPQAADAGPECAAAHSRPPTMLPQITALEWSTSRLRGPHGPTAVLATAGMDGRVRLWAAPQKLV